jgi:hypothetical protein
MSSSTELLLWNFCVWLPQHAETLNVRSLSQLSWALSVARPLVADALAFDLASKMAEVATHALVDLG